MDHLRGSSGGAFPGVECGVDRDAGRQVGEEAADEDGEFKAMAATGAGDEDVGACGMGVDEESLLRGDRVKAGLGRNHLGVGEDRQVSAEKPSDQGDVVVVDSRVTLNNVGTLNFWKKPWTTFSPFLSFIAKARHWIKKKLFFL